MKPLLLSSFLLLSSIGVHAADATYADFLETARTQFEAKNYDAARASMQSALAVAKTPEEKFGALSRIAKTFDEQKNAARAREFYEQAAAQPGIDAPNRVLVLFAIGEDLHQEKQLDKAQKVFEDLLADPQLVDPQAPKEIADVVRYNLGQVLLERGETARGRTLLSSLGDSNAQTFLRFGAWIQLGQSFRDEKNWEMARATFDKALALPDVSPAFQGVAHTERIKTFSGQNDVASAQKEAVLFAAEMLKAASNATPTSRGERLLAAMGVLDLPEAHTPPLFMATARERFATALLSQGDYVGGRTQLDEILKTVQPLEDVLATRSSALNIKTLVLWDLAGSYEREGNPQKMHELLEQLLQIPDVAPFYKDAAQKKLAGEKK
ncbi:hypothetical protein IAD21_01807 [Abditibacteriota bacterium]|nr:hypothetical protein IAD21_01807 [Abditibacteriota bacterium]